MRTLCASVSVCECECVCSCEVALQRASVCVATCEVSEQQVASVPWVARGGRGPPLSLLQTYVKGMDPWEDMQRRDTSAPFSSPPFTQHRGTEGRTEGRGVGEEEKIGQSDVRRGRRVR